MENLSMVGASSSLQGRERLTIAAAAKRVHRDRRTIHRWLAAGMPSHLHAGARHIWLDDLQATFVARLEADITRPRSVAAVECGTPQRYWNGCRCTPCKAANAADRRARYARQVQETAERRAKAAGRVGEPVVSVLPRPYRRRGQEAA